MYIHSDPAYMGRRVPGASLVFVAENIVGKKGRVEAIKSHCTQYSLSNMDIIKYRSRILFFQRHCLETTMELLTIITDLNEIP